MDEEFEKLMEKPLTIEKLKELMDTEYNGRTSENLEKDLMIIYKVAHEMEKRALFSAAERQADGTYTEPAKPTLKFRYNEAQRMIEYKDLRIWLQKEVHGFLKLYLDSMGEEERQVFQAKLVKARRIFGITDDETQQMLTEITTAEGITDVNKATWTHKFQARRKLSIINAVKNVEKFSDIKDNVDDAEKKLKGALGIRSLSGASKDEIDDYCAELKVLAALYTNDRGLSVLNFKENSAEELDMSDAAYHVFNIGVAVEDTDELLKQEEKLRENPRFSSIFNCVLVSEDGSKTSKKERLDAAITGFLATCVNNNIKASLRPIAEKSRKKNLKKTRFWNLGEKLEQKQAEEQRHQYCADANEIVDAKVAAEQYGEKIDAGKETSNPKFKKVSKAVYKVIKSFYNMFKGESRAWVMHFKPDPYRKTRSELEEEKLREAVNERKNNVENLNLYFFGDESRGIASGASVDIPGEADGPFCKLCEMVGVKVGADGDLAAAFKQYLKDDGPDDVFRAMTLLGFNNYAEWVQELKKKKEETKKESAEPDPTEPVAEPTTETEKTSTKPSSSDEKTGGGRTL